MARSVLLVSGAALAALFLPGCLFPASTGEAALGPPPRQPPPGVRVGADAPLPRPLSDYGPHPPVIPMHLWAPAEPGDAIPARLEIQAIPVTEAPPPQPPEPPAGSSLPAPSPPEPPLVAALRGGRARRPAEARRILAASDRPNREQVLALLRLAGELEAGRGPSLAPEEITAILAHLDTLATGLRGRAALVLDRVCFC